MATSKARIHDSFQERLQELAAHADAQYRHVADGSSRPWQLPPGIDPLDIPGLGAGHDRDAIGANYEECIADAVNPGTFGDVKGLKTQSDYLAVLERGIRARHATPVRCLVHASGRRRAHGHPLGIPLGAVLRWAQDAIAAGQAAGGGDG